MYINDSGSEKIKNPSLTGCLYIEHRHLYRLPVVMRDLVHKRFEWILGKMDSSIKSSLHLHSPDTHEDILMSQRIHLRRNSDESDVGVAEFRISDPDLQVHEEPRPTSPWENREIDIKISQEVNIMKKFDNAVLTHMESYASDVDFVIYSLQRLLDDGEGRGTDEDFEAKQVLREKAMDKFPCWEFEHVNGRQKWR